MRSISLAEKMAERMEAERRGEQEMEFARQVQARLFPQKLPAMKTLEYAGDCIQARTVGGDYYDFLELRPGRLALVLADIAGKGVSGALLMANLQATCAVNTRSRSTTCRDCSPRSTACSTRTPTMPVTRPYSLRITTTQAANSATRIVDIFPHSCCVPAEARGSGSKAPKVERLRSTCTVMGLFEAWQCEIAEVQLAAGDTLVLYTDGVTEATNADGRRVWRVPFAGHPWEPFSPSGGIPSPSSC